MAGDISRKNGQKGGRPPGTKDPETLEKEAALSRFRERVRQNIDPLFDAQYTLAQGCSYLFRMDEYMDGKVKRKKPILA